MPNPLKIQKIEIQNFRGFPGPVVYTFELNGNNLLLYGENGSGKSTLFYAIREFFDLDYKGNLFRDQKNQFSNDVGGQISITFNDNNQPAAWSALTDRPFKDVRVSQTALRTACLDYRAILRTSFAHTGDEVNLFDLLVNHLLVNYPVTVAGGVTRTLSSVWENVKNSVPERNTKPNLLRIDEQCDQFNGIIDLEIQSIEKKAEAFLNYFPECNIILHLKPQKVIYNPSTHQLENQKILLEVDFNNTHISGHQHFLNEARLSAIALALYLCSAKHSVPLDLPGAPVSLKLLVLDDVVIGLDLSNRLPLLDILIKEYGDWQIILMTYDKVWFDMVRMRNPDWECEEIFSDPSLIPKHKKFDGGFIGKAKEHLQNNDEQAAAVYARAEFERRLKKYCEKLHVKLQYKQPPGSPDTADMLDSLENQLKTDAKWADPIWQAYYPPLFLNMRTVRKVVLNPLSHSQLISLAKAEVQNAIDAVEQFKLIK